MGLRDWFSKKQEASPSETPVERSDIALGVITNLLRVDRDERMDGSWITFEATSGDRRATIEIADNHINCCLQEVDLPVLLREIGLEELAGVVTCGGDKNPDHTMWTVPGASPEELAAVVDAVFTHRLGMKPGYRVQGTRQA